MLLRLILFIFAMEMCLMYSRQLESATRFDGYFFTVESVPGSILTRSRSIGRVLFLHVSDYMFFTL